MGNQSTTVVDWTNHHQGVTGFDSGRRCGRSEPWSPEPR